MIMQINPNQYIENLRKRKIPYTVNILGTEITINNHNVYPSGKLAEFFLTTLIEKIGVKNKNIADIGTGCSTLGIIMTKHGAKQVVGVDITKASVECSKLNIAKNSCEDQVQILKGNGLEPLKNYENYFDFIVSGIPWSTMNQNDFKKLPIDDQEIYKSFFDMEDHLITSLIKDSWPLLKNNGCIFITACFAIMNRLTNIFNEYNVSYNIIAKKDIHNDGNDHYILELNKNWECSL